MQVSSRWRTASLVAGALLIGSVLGPPLARAAAAGLVRIEGGHTSNLAAVSRSGRLSVDAGLTTTRAGQVTVAVTDPRSLVVAAGSTNCGAGGIYKIPAGKALIITGAEFVTAAATSGQHELILLAGRAANPCARQLAIAADKNQPFASQNQVFNPGIPVPAGDAVGLFGSNDVGLAFVYGYLVPAAAVPARALKHVRAGVPGGPTAVAPPR